MSTPRIFVSHSHEDNDFVQRLVIDLRAHVGEENVWYDASGGLHGGDEWWKRIIAEITARNIFLVVLSPHAVASKWVEDEVNIAWNLKNSLGTRIVPILYQPCEVNAALATLQYVSFVDLPYADAFADLLQTLGIEQDERPAPPREPAAMSSSQLVQRLTQETHVAFAAEDWSTVIAKTSLILEEAPQAMTSVPWRERGFAFLRTGQTESALAAFDAALRLDPYDSATLRAHAQALCQQGQADDAIREWVRAYDLAPIEDTTLRLAILDDLVAALLQQRRWDEALRRIEEGERLSQNDSHWQVLRLTAYFESGDAEQLKRSARLASATHQAVVRQWLEERYQACLAAHDTHGMLLVVEVALSLGPTELVWRERKLAALTEAGDMAAALALANDLATENSEMLRRWVVAQYTALQATSDAQTLLQVIEIALKIAPNNPDWSERKLDAYVAANREDDALALAGEMAPWHGDMVRTWLIGRYEAHQQAGELDRALAIADFALQRQPNDAAWQQRRLDTLIALARWSDALPLARTLTGQQGASVAQWLQRAQVANHLRHRPEVRESVEAAARLAPRDPAVVRARKKYGVVDPGVQRRRLAVSGVAAVAALLLVVFVLVPITANTINQIHATATETAVAATAVSNSATATAFVGVAPSHVTAKYVASPGPGTCDKNASEWSPDNQGTTHASCIRGAFQLSVDSGSSSGAENFNVATSSNSVNFSATITIQLGAPNSCGGFQNLVTNNYLGNFEICGDGNFIAFDGMASLANNYASAQDNTLTISCIKDYLTVSANGHIIVNEANQCSDISQFSLVVQPEDGTSAASATFYTFSFTQYSI